MTTNDPRTETAARQLSEGNVSDWNQYVNDAPPDTIACLSLAKSILRTASFSGLHLSNSKFNSVHFVNANFDNASIDNTQFTSCRFTDCTFINTSGFKNTLDTCTLQRASFSHAKYDSFEFHQCRISQSTFSQSAFKNSSFHGTTALDSSFEQCQLQGTILPSHARKCNLSGAALTKSDAGGTFKQCKFVGAGGQDVYWRDTTLVDCDFSGSKLHLLEFHRSKLFSVNFKNSTLHHGDWTEAHVEGCSLEGADLTESQFTKTTFLNTNASESNFTKSRFDSSLFERCDLTNAEFRGSESDTDTQFFQNKTQGTHYGNPNSRNDALVSQFRRGTHNDLPRLQFQYSGSLRWIHLSALCIFLMPYTWHLLDAYIHSRPKDSSTGESISVLESILGFIYKGSSGTRLGGIPSFSFLLFLFSLAYNTLRAMLVAKVWQLEMRESLQGRTAAFRIEAPVVVLPILGGALSWGALLKVARYGFWINLVVVAAHSVLFMMRRIPMD